VSSESCTNSAIGLGALLFNFLLCFAFLGIIEFAQDFTFLGFRPAFRDEDFNLSDSAKTSSSSTIGDVIGESNEESAGSDTLVGRPGTELSQRLGSDRKKPRRLAGILREAGLVIVGDTGDSADMGRFRLNRSLAKGGLCC